MTGVELAGSLVRDLGGVTMTAEVWPNGQDGADLDACDQAMVVDVVRIGDRLHFVVVLDD